MKQCPDCDRENGNNARNCFYCGRYLPQTEYNSDYSLVIFLKKNETLFTIMGVFLILAFIFNSTQLNISLDPVPNTYNENSTRFSFLCLWVSAIIFFVIFLDLYSQLKSIYPRLKYLLLNFNSKEEFFREYSIIILVPAFVGIALMFLELLIERFQKYASIAFLITISEISIIETLGLFALLLSFYKKEKDSPRRIFAFSLINLILAVAIGILFIIPKYSFSIILTPLGIILSIFGVLGLIRYFKIKNNSMPSHPN